MPLDGNIEHYLQGRVIPPLAAVVGARLVRVIYWCPDQWSDEFISRPLFETTGEVELEFSNGEDVHVTWKQNAIWFGDNAVWVYSDSRTEERAYARCEANVVPLWQPIIGNVLRNIEVLGWGGWDAEVRAVKFCFDDTTVYIGVGLMLQSDDDVFVRSESEFFRWSRANEAKVVWSATMK
ncbi:MAG: hypothetical protein M3176_02675 [Chloroflexota bacterium]|nr:hypothetical protein [Chloroflexota bacterium]